MEKYSSYVLDTSAILCLKDDESGADSVESILRDAARNRCRIVISFMTLMEYLYINEMRAGKDEARRAYIELNQLPIKVLDSNEELGILATDLKASHKISVADAWIAATAIQTGSVLVHKDPEYESLKKKIAQIALPYKKKRRAGRT